ncbi:hypothetical protein OROGR_015406 [Orobanche gracilis]
MAKVFLSAFVVFLSLISVCNLHLARGANAAAQKTWCVAKPSSDEQTLQNHINYVCIEQGQDCSIFKQRNPCFSPDTKINHASIAMNIYYQKNGRNKWNCDFKGTGLITTTDPSYGSCKYA